MTHRICFVCLGNICRSPTAEAVLRQLVADAGLDGEFVVDSAGTGSWHIGEPPDPRAQAEARQRGLDLTALRGRQVSGEDFERFDLLLAMDEQNQRDLLALAPTEEARSKVRLLREFDEDAVAAGELEVPDPYYGGRDGFAVVYDAIERACRGLLASLSRPG
jgi:protein-tyrosine phosphatase